MSQPLAVSCPHCRAQFAVQDPSLIGKQVRCPGCANPFVVAAGQQPARPAPPAAPAAQQPRPAAPAPQPQATYNPRPADPLADPLGGGGDPFGGDPLGGGDPLAADPFAADPFGSSDPLGGGFPTTTAPQRPMAAGGAYAHRGKKKSNWQKPAMIGGGVVLGLLMLYGLISLLMGGGGASRGGDGNVVDMTWLPADTEVVGFVDVNRIVRSNLVQDWVASDPNIGTAIDKMEQELGIGPRDIESFTIGGSSQGKSGLVVVRLSKDFDPAKLGAQVEEVSGRKVYAKNGNKVLVPDARTLVFGEPASVAKAAQQGDAKQRFKQFDFADAGQDFFFCAAPKDPSEFRKAAGKAPPMPMGAPEGVAEAITAFQNHTTAFAFGGSLSGNRLGLKIQVNTDDGGASRDISGGLSTMLSEAQKQYQAMSAMIPADAKPIADSVVNSLDVDRSGTSVALSLALPVDKMKEAIGSKMGGMGGLGMPRMPSVFGGMKNPLEGLGDFGGLLGGGSKSSSRSSSGSTSGSSPMGALGSGAGAAQVAANRNKLVQIGLAFHNFHDTFRSLPPAADGKGAGLSWRVHLLPFLEHQALYNRFNMDEPWDSPTNRALLNQMPDIFKMDGVSTAPGKTVVLGISADGGLMSDPAKGKRFRDVIDGTSNTAVAVVASPQIQVDWTKPADYDGLNPAMLHPFSSPSGPFHMVLLLDGSVFNLPATLATQQWENLFRFNDGNPVDLN
ncbi:MAG: DUF1559 domain-containing protein [Planctomycetales bacterium]|nr:DUF1559 domain-containing protein [Planctomycetales bacterium]